MEYRLTHPMAELNLRARYEWELGKHVGALHAVSGVIDKQYSDIITINRDEIDSYTLVNLFCVVSPMIPGRANSLSTMQQMNKARNFVNDVERKSGIDLFVCVSSEFLIADRSCL